MRYQDFSSWPANDTAPATSDRSSADGMRRRSPGDVWLVWLMWRCCGTGCGFPVQTGLQGLWNSPKEGRDLGE